MHTEERAVWRDAQELYAEEKKRADEIRMVEIQREAEEKKRADEIQMTQTETAKDQAIIEAEKEIALKEMELKAQAQASSSAAVNPPSLNRDAKSLKLPAS